MYKIAFMLKTYDKDYPYAERLLKSFNKYNADHIPCFVVAPKNSMEQLDRTLTDSIKQDVFFVSEEDFSKHLVNEAVCGIAPGYINQEIIKLAFWEKGLCEYYVCLYSDAIFIRHFHTSGFMYDDNSPYTVLFEDKWLKTDPDYYKNFWIDREKSLTKILTAIDYAPKIVKTCHGFQIFSKKVIENMKKEYMDKHGYDYVDLIEISPYEFSWYNFWLQKTRVVEIHEIDQLFVCLHTKKQLLISWLSERSIEDLARGYVGVVINSNFLSGKMIDFDGKQDRNKGYIEIAWWTIKAIIYNIVRK